MIKTLHKKNIIENDFIQIIEKWSIKMAYHLDISFDSAYPYAIEEVLNLSNKDFFEEFSCDVYEIIKATINFNEEKVRNQLDKMFKLVADKNYDHGFAYLEKFYKIKATDQQNEKQNAKPS